jgi:uncharacterized Zn finger protein
MNPMNWHENGFFRRPTIAERKALALRTLEKLEKRGPLYPVAVGSPLAVTWWGKAWNRNLESYADYANRIGRGRSYARNGSILDLRIAPAEISALVQGSRPQPYKVRIDITTMSGPSQKTLAEVCSGKLESAEALLKGRFPEDMQGILTSGKYGLFPSPKQIQLSCSCPDWASMCKHIAAALYGVGARLDQDPSLFFVLRGMQAEQLVSRVIRESAEKLLTGRGGGESKVLGLDDAGLGELFGLDFGRPETKSREGRIPIDETDRKVKQVVRKRKNPVSKISMDRFSASREQQLKILWKHYYHIVKGLSKVEKELKALLES